MDLGAGPPVDREVLEGTTAAAAGAQGESGKKRRRSRKHSKSTSGSDEGRQRKKSRKSSSRVRARVPPAEGVRNTASDAPLRQNVDNQEQPNLTQPTENPTEDSMGGAQGRGLAQLFEPAHLRIPERVPNQGVSDRRVSNQGRSDQGVSNQGRSGRGVSNDGVSNEGVSNQRASIQAVSTQRAPIQGESNQVSANEEVLNPAVPNQGTQNSGVSNERAPNDEGFNQEASIQDGSDQRVPNHGASNQGASSQAQASASAPRQAPREPVFIQFFVKSLEGKTIVMREPKNAFVGDLKIALLESMTRGKEQRCLGSVFLTYEGKPLNDGTSLGAVPITEGGTLRMCVRFQSTMYLSASEHAAKLRVLVRDLALETSVGRKRRELLSNVLEVLYLFLRPVINERQFVPLDYAMAFISGGGVEAIASLLCSKSGFLAVSCVRMVSERIDTLPDDNPLRTSALHLAWHLLEAFLEKPWPVESDCLEQCLNSLSCLTRTKGAADVDVWNSLPRSAGKNGWCQLFIDVFVRLGKKMRTKVEADVARFGAEGSVESGAAQGIPFLAELLQFLGGRFTVQAADAAPYDKSVRKLFKSLSKTLKTLLGAAVDTAVDRETAARIVDAPNPGLAILDSRLAGFQSPSIESSVRHLPAHLLGYIVVAVESMVVLANGSDGLTGKMRTLIEEKREALSGLLMLRTEQFYGLRELKPLFERPYRHLWRLSLKEQWLADNLPVFCPVGAYEMTVRRDHHLLADAFNWIGAVDPGDLHRGISVRFLNEEGTGPGVTREFFTKVAEALFNPEFALFRTAPADRRRIFPNANSGFNSAHLAYFRFCGRVVALALAQKSQLGVTFCPALLDALWGPAADAAYRDGAGHAAARDIDPELYESCEKLLKMSEAEFNGLGLTFVYSRESLGAHHECELIPGGSGIEVKYNERELFVRLKVRHQLLEPVRDQIDALREGMRSVFTQEEYIWQHVYGVLTEQEFACLLQGAASELSIDDWKAHTTYHGYSEDDRVIKRFWRAVLSLSSEQRRNLLHFTTAVRYLPSTGFAGLPDRFHIFSTESGVDTLPTSHTCYFQLVLPKYKSTVQMTERLLTVSQGHIAEGFGSA